MEQEEALKNLIMQNDQANQQNKAEPTFLFIAHKAGMQQVDKAKVSAIVTEASRDSRFYNKQMAKKEKYDQTVDKMREKIAKFQKDKQQMQSVAIITQKRITELEKQRNLNRTWVHVDMDMFYVACEIRDNPSLKDKPVAVGGIGMISTANYIARGYGVRSAMPGFIAKKLCPELIFVKGDFEKYRETAKRFKNVIAEYDPDYESGGLDEAVLDLTNYLNEHGLSKPEEIEKVCYDMRMKINNATGITCSCGIAANKMLSKLSTEINKPNGQFYMKPVKEEILTFLSKLPVRKIPGIGSTSEQVLNGLGIVTCQDILDHISEVYVAFTENAFDFFLRSALGISRCYHELPEERKSINVSRTFPVISKLPDMERKVQEIADMLAEDLSHYKKKTKHLTLTVKTHNFDVKNRGMPIDRFTDNGAEIGSICIRLLRELTPLDPLRLIGIKAGTLSESENLNTLDNFFSKGATNKVDKPETKDKAKPLASDPPKEQTDSVTFPGMIEEELNENSKSLTSVPVQIKEKEQSKLQPQVQPQPKAQPQPQPQPEAPKILNREKPKVEEIICPICNMKFESAVNKTRINKHIDKCLETFGAGASEATTSTVTNNAINPNVVEASPFRGAMQEEKKDGRGRKKAEEGNLKKTKKTTEAPSTKGLNNFFTKK